MEIFEFCSVPAIALFCFFIVELIKKMSDEKSSMKNLYPIISAFLGTLSGGFVYAVSPDLIMGNSIISSWLIGLSSGLSATGGNEIFQRIRKKKRSSIEVVDESPARFFITGDKHRNFEKLIEFCEVNKLRKKDVIVILGDSGFNYYGDERDDKLKKKISKVKVTLFCLHGNKENRVQNIPTYGIRTFCGGQVYYEPKYSNIFFAQDGETYTFNGKQFIVVGGAHSVDKYRCLDEDLPFWYDEMPSDDIKKLVETRLAERENKIYGLLTHTCPISCLPEEMFISTRRANDQRKGSHKSKRAKRKEYKIDVDRSTETWLESIKENNEFDIWYCGHYHVDKELDNIHMMHNEIIPFCSLTESNGR